VRHLVFADIAEKEGYSNVARLFKAIAYSEKDICEKPLR